MPRALPASLFLSFTDPSVQREAPNSGCREKTLVRKTGYPLTICSHGELECVHKKMRTDLEKFNVNTLVSHFYKRQGAEVMF